jgi:hypothetical protein
LKAPANVERFAAGFSSTWSVAVESLDREPGPGNVVRVSIVATDFLNSKYVSTPYSGTWTLIQEFGQLKLDSAKHRAESLTFDTIYT